MIDNLCFAVIYAIPNLSYHYDIAHFGQNTPNHERIMNIKLEMQKKVIIQSKSR